VPAYGPQNDVTLKMPAFEWVHVQLHQQKGMISLSPPTICNSAWFCKALTVSLSGCVVPFKHQLCISFKNPLINPVNT
ncbi:hypothetical protein, partial [Escherichia coli]|uniref:hypothetical protein n=1 Tax=Escherichia coli TaxID=562 RepID=UPI001BE3F1BA